MLAGFLGDWELGNSGLWEEPYLPRICVKGWVHCFSMQVVMNKCFLLNLEKKFGTDLS